MNHHHVEKLQCKLQITDKALHKPLQNQLMQFYDSGLFQVLDKVFTQFSEHNFEIPLIELVLPPIPKHQFVKFYLPLVESTLTGFLENYCKEFETKLRVKKPTTPPKDALFTLLFYLQKGYYPQPKHEDFTVLWDTVFTEKPKTLIQQLVKNNTPAVIQRLVYQLSEDQLWSFIPQLYSSTKILKKYYTFISPTLVQNTAHKTTKNRNTVVFWRELLMLLLQANSSDTGIASLISAHIKACFYHFKTLIRTITTLQNKVPQLRDERLRRILKPILFELSHHVSSPYTATEKKQWLDRFIKNIPRKPTLQNSLLQKELFDQLTFKEQEHFLFKLSLTYIEQWIFKKRPSIQKFYKAISAQFSTSIPKNELHLFKELFYRFAYRYFLQSPDASFQLLSFIHHFHKFVQQSTRIPFSQKQDFLQKIHSSAKVLIQHKKISLSDEIKSISYTPATIPVSSIILHFLASGSFSGSNPITFQEFASLLKSLFETHNTSKWKQQYINFRHKGKHIYPWVLENYFSQTTAGVSYIVQLDEWYSIRKAEVYHFKKGMQKRQHRKTDFATQIITRLPEEKVNKVIGFVEPEYQSTILIFIENSISVAKIQSLTDKLTDLKKEIYAFVLSYLLLESGYNFNKQQFVAHQIQQLAQHFNIAYLDILQLFLDTLDPNASFGKEKEIYFILYLLKTKHHENTLAYTLADSLTNPLLKKDITLKQKSGISIWIRLLCFYLKHQYFPKWSSIKSFQHLTKEVPISLNKKKEFSSFLKSQKELTRFFKSEIALKHNITLDRLTQHIFLQKELFPTDKSTIKITSRDTIPISDWVTILIYFLKYRSFPKWSSIKHIDLLAKKFPIAISTKKELLSFFHSQIHLKHFLISKANEAQRLTLAQLSQLILNQKGISNYKKQESQFYQKQPANLLQKEGKAHWVAVFLYYLEHQELPWWSSFTTEKQLLNTPLENKNIPKQIAVFLQQQKHTSSIWHTIDFISKNRNFKSVLISWFIPSKRQHSFIKSIARLFSPYSIKEQQQFSEYFGRLPNGSLFWKTLWASRSLFFTDSLNNVMSFCNHLQQEYTLKSTAFNTAILQTLKGTKAAGNWEFIISKKTSQTPVKKSYSYAISKEHILKKLLDGSETITPTEKTFIHQEFISSPNLVQHLNLLFYKKSFSKKEIKKLFFHWTTILFPKIKTPLFSLYKELEKLEYYSKSYTLEDLKYSSFFIWKAAAGFNLKNPNIFLQALLLDIAKNKKTTFHILISTYTEDLINHRKSVPLLYHQIQLLHTQLHLNQKSSDVELPIIPEPQKQIHNSQNIEELPEIITLPNAGTILLWKFIPLFLKRLEIWDSEKNTFYNEHDKCKAVIAIYYLATGLVNYESEHELLIAKILCGVPLEYPIEEVTLTEKDQQLADDLLRAAILQWKKLGTLSIQGFRNTFLTREGVLHNQEDTFHITIESTGKDILLDYLPWTISTIRLPWLEKKLLVSWREKNSFSL